MTFDKVWAANFGDSTGDEQRKMMRVISQLLDADMEFIVMDDRGGTGTWEIVIIDLGGAHSKFRTDPVNLSRLLRKLEFRQREATSSVSI